MSDITFEFDIDIDGDCRDAADAFASTQSGWSIKHGRNGGVLVTPSQLPDAGLGAACFVAQHVEAYPAQLSALRLFGRGHSMRIAVYFDLSKIAALSLVLKPSTMAMISMLGYEIDFCVYPCGPDEEA